MTDTMILARLASTEIGMTEDLITKYLPNFMIITWVKVITDATDMMM